MSERLFREHGHRDAQPRPFLRPTIEATFSDVQVPVRSIAFHVPLSAELAREIDQHHRPWRYPDPPRFPAIVLLPRLQHAAAIVAEARYRLAMAIDVLRYGVQEDE